MNGKILKTVRIENIKLGVIYNLTYYLKYLGFYERLVTNSKSEDIKVMISMGGWTDSAGDKYSKLISSGVTRRR